MLITMAHVKVGDILDSRLVVVVNVLDAGEMGRRKDLSDFYKGQIVMARRLGWSTKAARLVGPSRAAVVSTF